MRRWPVVLAAAAVMAACLWPLPEASAAVTRFHAAELTDPAALPEARLGRSVAIEGDTLVVGAPFDGNGAIHVFERDPATGLWAFAQELRPPGRGTLPGDWTGWSVAIHNQTIVAGSPSFDNETIGKGGVQVFRRDAGTGKWAFERRLIHPSLADGDDLGSSVAVNAEWVVAGAPGDGGTGVVHAWRRAGWVHHELPAFGVGPGGRLGASAAVQGDLIVAGAPSDAAGGSARGSVHLYLFDSTAPVPEWGHYQELGGAVADYDYLGWSVAIDGPNIVAGAPGRNLVGNNDGAVFLYSPAGATWTLSRVLVAPDAAPGAELGYSVAIEGNEVFAGAQFDDSRAPFGGAVSVFDRTTGYRLQELTDPFASQSDNLGAAVAVDGGVFAAGAPFDDAAGADAGAVHLFADLPDDLLCMGQGVSQIGTSGDDTLTGTPGRDVIRGYGGNDTITGFGGGDTICGDAGDDTLLGGPGDDGLYGGDGNDRVRGGGGNDMLSGGAGSDRLIPDTGDDCLDGGFGSDIVDYLGADGPVNVDLTAGTATYTPLSGGTWTVYLTAVEKVDGTRYDDEIRGDGKRNVLRGKQGVDLIKGGGGDDDLIGGTGDDDIYGGDGDDLIKGQADDDLLEGEGGADKIRGGNGDDTVRGGDGDDTLFGGLLRHQGVFTNVIDGGAGTDVCRWWFDDPINCD